jgi:F-type H+-transporting ATPase subunit gamma
MATLKDIRKRITSVRSTQKITRAMKLVAAARLRRSQDAAIHARNYADEMERLIYRVSASVGEKAPELMRRRSDVGSLDLMVISSDRGLCGGFNETLMNRVGEAVRLHERHGVKVQLFIYGKKGIEACRKRGLLIASAEELGVEAANVDRMHGIIDTLIDRFLKGHNDGSFLVYNYFRSTAAHDVVFKDLLPFHQRRRDRTYQVEYLFEPSKEGVIDELIHSTLTAMLAQAFRESYVSELAARMMAMGAATKNADDMIDHLTMVYHRARQGAITRELMDIINGAEALRGGVH